MLVNTEIAALAYVHLDVESFNIIRDADLE